jgi:predicted Zn-dependent protease
MAVPARSITVQAMDNAELRRKRCAEWWRLAAGCIGASLNAFGLLATTVGVLAQSFRDQESGSDAAGAFHLGYLGFHPVATYFLLSRLTDEEQDARVTVGVWAAATTAVWLAYWSWAL